MCLVLATVVLEEPIPRIIPAFPALTYEPEFGRARRPRCDPGGVGLGRWLRKLDDRVIGIEPSRSTPTQRLRRSFVICSAISLVGFGLLPFSRFLAVQLIAS